MTQPPSTPQRSTWEEAIAALVEQLTAHRDQSPQPAPALSPATLTQLGDRFQLSPFEQWVILLCLGQAIEPRISQLCGEIHGSQEQQYPTLGLALSVFPQAQWRILSPQSPLFYWQLIHLAPHLTLTQAPLSLDRRILCYLLAEPAFDPELTPYITPITGAPSRLPPSQNEIVQQILTAWSHAPARLPLIQICSPDRAAIRAIAQTLSQQIHFNLYQLQAAALPNGATETYNLGQRWQREAHLSHALLLIEDPEPHHSLAPWLIPITTPTLLSTRERHNFAKIDCLTLELPPLSYAERYTLWQEHLGDRTPPATQLYPLVAQFNLNAEAIAAACIATQASPPAELPSALWQICRRQARPQLEHLAQRIEATATWEDLILPERDKTILRDIAIQVQQRATVYEDWGFAGKSSRGLGISTLFAGASGTGKTMAAEVLAREFELDLYRIDLSAVSSKYIGETEKNLRQIFDAAEAGGVVLLFDEADALFGKRTQVKDSHDRHANLEVSYLLQRMEAYQGLAILTTNLKDSLDSAFLRRLRFVINFPFPNVEYRRQIWQHIFPKKTPLGDLDYQELAQLDVAGGNIRAIALNSAFLAASMNEPVMMKHLLQAAQAEYLKLGRILTHRSGK
ncbi:ATP-binding protein [Spirulina sp. CCNP1310]|uniref:ATP-binding protein n=1 Tax=Spirulina sp. CCNP1310 TaxID=3110249 RepID=UPI002B212498|nr:ATP-binding protein [Spirulina sp. CCNP1310]MEA5420033.1 ATP-binding protein [Spirulina sp. CCNP1310]